MPHSLLWNDAGKGLGDPGVLLADSCGSFHEPIDAASAPFDTNSKRDSTSVADDYAQ